MGIFKDISFTAFVMCFVAGVLFALPSIKVIDGVTLATMLTALFAALITKRHKDKQIGGDK